MIIVAIMIGIDILMLVLIWYLGRIARLEYLLKLDQLNQLSK